MDRTQVIRIIGRWRRITNNRWLSRPLAILSLKVPSTERIYRTDPASKTERSEGPVRTVTAFSTNRLEKTGGGRIARLTRRPFCIFRLRNRWTERGGKVDPATCNRHPNDGDQPAFLATMAGARILDQGGNAFDAAVAVSACLAVVYPHMTGIGGMRSG